MEDVVLLEMVKRWEHEGKEPDAEDGSEGSKLHNAMSQGERKAKRNCANRIRQLIQLLGDPDVLE